MDAPMGRGRKSAREAVTQRASTMIPPPPTDPAVLEAMWRVCLDDTPADESDAPTRWQQAAPTWVDEVGLISDARDLCA
jgi:hypothetical protein